MRDLYLAHLALSDLDGGHFYHTERLNRAGPGLAGASQPCESLERQLAGAMGQGRAAVCKPSLTTSLCIS